MRGVTLAICSFAWVAFLNASPVSAQSYTHTNLGSAGVHIHVVDPIGAGLPGARVVLKERSRNERIAGAADKNGRAQLWGHFSGRYQLTVSAPGFQPSIEEVNLLPGEVLELTAVLPVIRGDTIAVEPEWQLNRDSFQAPELPLPAAGTGVSPLRN